MLKIKLPYDSAILFLVIYLEKNENSTIIPKDTNISVFKAALFIIAKTWKQSKGPLTDDWIKKM